MERGTDIGRDGEMELCVCVWQIGVRGSDTGHCRVGVQYCGRVWGSDTIHSL